MLSSTPMAATSDNQDLVFPQQQPPSPDPRGRARGSDAHSTSTSMSSTPTLREGYGFRPLAGSSTPPVGRESPLPDPNGLGWPGKHTHSPHLERPVPSSHHLSTAKSTLSRLNSTPEERTAREERLAGAVRTLLECIGEDPDREGLRRTPERYAQALMWMTRGYEERLAGAAAYTPPPPILFDSDTILITCYHLDRCNKRCHLPRGP